MFLQYYGLREQPFGVTPNPRFLYHGPAHREALASLIYGIEADLGFAALIAEPGMGKTTLLFYLLEKFRPTARTALVFQTQCTPLEMLRYVANELEVKAEEDDPVVLNDRIRQALVRDARAGRRVILIVDEAQNLSEESLEAIRLLSDFETPDFKLLHIILAGQPKLAEKLAQPGLSQLLQRIAMLNRLLPFTAKDDVARYIAYRLKVAGYSGPPLFTDDGLEMIATHSGGIPRQINRLCFNALSLGCVIKKRHIDADIVREVVNDLDLQSLLPGGAPGDAEKHSALEHDSSQSVNEPQRPSDPRRSVSHAVPVSTGTNGRSPDRVVLPEIAVRTRPMTPAVGNSALALSPSELDFIRTAAEPFEIARTAPRAAARPQLVKQPGPQPRATSSVAAVVPAQNVAPTRPRVTAKVPKAVPVRNDGRLSLALIVACVIAVPLLILAVWKYAEHEHLLPGAEQPVAVPSSVETAPENAGSVQNGNSISLPPATAPNTPQRPKKQGPRSRLMLSPAPVPATWVGTQPSISSIVIIVQS